MVSLLASSVALGGCSGGTVSATDDQAQVSSTATNSIIERIKGIFKSESKSMSIEMPLSTLIFQAVQEDMKNKGMENFFVPTFTVENFCFGFKEIAEVYGVEQPPSIKVHAQGILDSIEKSEGKDQSKWEENVKIGYAMFKGVVDSNERALCTRLAILKSSTALGGWNAQQDMYEQAMAIFQAAWLSNQVEKIILSEMSTISSWKSDAVAKAKVNEIIERLGADGTIESLNRQWAKNGKGSEIRLDRTGSSPAPVHFTYLDSSGGVTDTAVSGTGTVLKSGGSPTFGDGYIDGKKVFITVQSVEGTTMHKQGAIRSEGESRSSNSQSNSTGVSN